MRAASALSTHPVVATALGEAAGQVIEALGGARPALVLVAVTPPHLGTLEDVGGALQVLLGPDAVVGAVAPAVIGGGRRVEAEPALALFAVSGVAASGLSLAPAPSGRLDRRGALDGATSAIVLADPFSCPPDRLLAALGDLPAAGGVVAPAWVPGRDEAQGTQGPGGSRLLLDGAVRTAGAVGALLGPPTRVRLSQGGTPAGEAWVVTRSHGDLVLELAGRPAAERRSQALGDQDHPAALGLLLDERAEDIDRTELLAVAIVGTVAGGGLRLSSPVPVGRVVRFLRAGALDVDADLAAALRPSRGDGAGGETAGGQAPVGVLLFPAAGRGGDAGVVADLVRSPVAGVDVAAPLGPVGGVLGLHGPRSTGLVLFP